MGLELLEKITDPYERKARLTPALLSLIPPVGVVVGLYGVKLQIEESLVGLLASAGLFYLMTSIARELGKRREEGLFASWGGKPTTQILRHRDSTIDPVTKARYHDFLSKQLGVPFPTMGQEQQDAATADHSYTAGAKWLLEQTRDTRKFSLLFAENIAYGFRRNCLGLKPYAVWIAVVSLAWVFARIGAVTSSGIHLEAFAGASVGAWASIAASVTALVVWLFFITSQTVRTAAFAYADMLLRACDVLPARL